MIKFTDFEVTRVGNIVVLSCFATEPSKGVKLQITLQLDDRETAEQHEAMLLHLVKCAQLYEYMPIEALDGTLQLTKGKDS